MTFDRIESKPPAAGPTGVKSALRTRNGAITTIDPSGSYSEASNGACFRRSRACEDVVFGLIRVNAFCKLAGAVSAQLGDVEPMQYFGRVRHTLTQKPRALSREEGIV